MEKHPNTLSLDSRTSFNSPPQISYSTKYETETVLYIRHGETAYNKAAQHLDAPNKLMEPSSVRWDEQYLDCVLSQTGIEQAKTLQAKLNPLKIFKIYSSPLRRCLETCIHALSSHPQKKDLVITVTPLLTEVAHTIHDGSIDLKVKKEYFAKFTDIKIDWGLMSGLDHTYNYKYLNQMPEFGGENGQGDVSQLKFTELVKASLEKSKKRLESVDSGFARTVSFKDEVIKTDFGSCNGEEIGKVLVFTHSGFLRLSSLAKSFTFAEGEEDKYPENVYVPKNCEIVGINVFL